MSSPNHHRDFTHGPLNMILYIAPSLQEHPQAAVVCNSLLNTRVWNGDTEFIHTYVWTCDYACHFS